MFKSSVLYIPHGSDNTLKYFVFKKLMINFISHMVQIIPSSFNSSSSRISFFISHMVQIIHQDKMKVFDLIFVFISHMVQIIPSPYISYFVLTKPLYIPHGSDNT